MTAHDATKAYVMVSLYAAVVAAAAESTALAFAPGLLQRRNCCFTSMTKPCPGSDLRACRPPLHGGLDKVHYGLRQQAKLLFETGLLLRDPAQTIIMIVLPYTLDIPICCLW